MFGIFLDYFSTLITNLKSFFCFIQIYVPDFCTPTTLACSFRLKYLSLTDIKQAA